MKHRAELLYKRKIADTYDYIDAHLHEKLSVEQLSAQAGFSPFHFQRIFHAFSGEPLYAAVNRLRLEKAAVLLQETALKISDIAFDVGFEDSATFARAFRKHFIMSATQWRALNQSSKKSRIHQEVFTRSSYSSASGRTAVRTSFSQNAAVDSRLQKYGQRYLLYVRHSGSYAGDAKLFQKLHLEFSENYRVELPHKAVPSAYCALYHDAPEVSEAQTLRLSYGVISDGEVPLEPAFEGLGLLQLKSGLYAEADLSVGKNDYSATWMHMYQHVIPGMNMKPVFGYCYESYGTDCYDAATGRTRVTLAVPVARFAEPLWKQRMKKELDDE